MFVRVWPHVYMAQWTMPISPGCEPDSSTRGSPHSGQKGMRESIAGVWPSLLRGSRGRRSRRDAPRYRVLGRTSVDVSTQRFRGLSSNHAACGVDRKPELQLGEHRCSTLPATSPKDVRFHLVDERGRRVHFRRYVAKDGAEQEGPGEESRSTDVPDRPSDTSATSSGEKEVEYGELMRGYETDAGLVVLDQEEIESVRPSRSRVIEIEDSVDLADVDPVYFEKSYVLAPQRDAEKPCNLLLRAMERAGRVGIGRCVLRTKPHRRDQAGERRARSRDDVLR